MAIEDGSSQNMNDEKSKTINYEQGYKSYKKLGLENEKGFDSWGSVVVTSPDGNEERASLYTDSRIARRMFTEPIVDYLKKTSELHKTFQLVDFGGGDGVMLHNINRQLSVEPGMPRISSTLLDIDEEKLESAQDEYPELKTQEGSVFSLPYEDESIDIGVSRMAIQYFSGFDPSETGLLFSTKPQIQPIKSLENTARNPEVNQLKMLKEIYRVLRPGGVLIVASPGGYTDSSTTDNISEFWNRITAARTGQSLEDVRKERAFTSGDILEWAASEAGFKNATEHPDGESVDWIDWRITPNAIFDRFNIDPNDPKTENLRSAIIAVFDQVKASESLPAEDKSNESINLPGKYITEWQGQKAIKLPIQRIAFHKPGAVSNVDNYHLINKSGLHR